MVERHRSISHKKIGSKRAIVIARAEKLEKLQDELGTKREKREIYSRKNNSKDVEDGTVECGEIF